MTTDETLRQDLLLMANGDTDGHSLFLLDAALDYAETGLPVDVDLLRAHCHQPETTIAQASIGILIFGLVDSIREWTRAADVVEAEVWAREIVADLFVLRHGTFPCTSCLAQAYSVAQIQPRVVGSLSCTAHRTPSLHDLVAPRGPLALVRPVA
jgi:hypothetical protein